MTISGIVAEYNPFHTGHAHQMDQTRQMLGQDTGIVVAMSGNWIQQADCAIADKWTRASLAILGGADLVLELPTLWATASAEAFSRGALHILSGTGVVTHLSFGSESGDISALKKVADAIDSQALVAHLRSGLGEGLSFPVARQRAVEALLGLDGAILRSPNNTLGIEYLRALSASNSQIIPITVLRQGGGHNSVPDGTGTAPAFTSATDLRGKLCTSADWDYVRGYLPTGGENLLRTDVGLPHLALCQRGMLAKLRTMSAEDWAQLPDSGEAEGLCQRLYRAGHTTSSYADFIDSVKTKRYTHARIRRLALWAFLGITQLDRPQTPPYIRVLAFNDRGRGILREMKEKATLPILTKPADAEHLGETGQRLFALENRCTDLYALCFDPIRPAGLEYTTSAIYRRE